MPLIAHQQRAGSSKITGSRSSTSAARSRILDPSMPIDEALAGIGGLLLTGGDDVAPSRYGEAAARRRSSKRSRDATSSRSR